MAALVRQPCPSDSWAMPMEVGVRDVNGRTRALLITLASWSESSRHIKEGCAAGSVFLGTGTVHCSHI